MMVMMQVYLLLLWRQALRVHERGDVAVVVDIVVVFAFVINALLVCITDVFERCQIVVIVVVACC